MNKNQKLFAYFLLVYIVVSDLYRDAKRQELEDRRILIEDMKEIDYLNREL